MSIEPRKEKKGETGEVRSLPKELWPSADRSAWEAACRPGLRLIRGGAASHMRPVTQKDLAKRYGYFLDFLCRFGRIDLDANAGAQVTLENIEQYVDELKKRVSSVTVYGSIQKLRSFTQLIAPDCDLAWLKEIERELCSQIRPKSKWDRVVLAEVISETALTLIAEAELSVKLPKLSRARMVRNGLMLPLLAQYPIRLKNFAALELGRSLVKIDETWWILLTAAETKEKRADERPIEHEIAEALEKYLDEYRPILCRGTAQTNALWVGIDGTAMAECSIRETVTETTRSVLGVAINPHLFRTAASTTAAIHAADKPHLGSAVLHHSHPTVTLENYCSSLCRARFQTLLDSHSAAKRRRSLGNRIVQLFLRADACALYETFLSSPQTRLSGSALPTSLK
jgi:site-specific recombinase XerD